MAKDNKVINLNEVKEQRNNVDVKLSLTEKDQAIVSDVQKEMLEDEIAELLPIKEGDINVAGVYAFEDGDRVEVKIYIRNGFDKKISLEDVNFGIINSKGETLAYQMFDLRGMGYIPAKAARPWKLYFDKENLNVEKIPTDDWKVVFDTALSTEYCAIIDEYENLPQDANDFDKNMMNAFLSGLPNVKVGECSISTFSIAMHKDGQILVSLVIRNGADKTMAISKLPITIVTSDNQTLASAVFDTKGLRVHSKKALIYNIAFDTEFKLEEDTELKNCRVVFEV